METYLKSKPISERPVPFFSGQKGIFFESRRHKLTDHIPCCFEDGIVRFFVLDGLGKIRINGIDFPLKEGTLCVLQSFHAFEIFSEDDSPLEIQTIVIDTAFSNYLNLYDANHMSSEEMEILFDYVPVFHLKGQERKVYETLLSNFEKACQRPNPNPIIKTALIGQMGVLETRFMQRKNTNFTYTLGWQIITFITKYSNHNLTLKTISDHFGISASLANRELRKITTYNFDDLLGRARVNATCAILPLKGFSQQYLSNFVGFPSEKAFYNTFYKWKNMTPMMYRKKIPGELYAYSNNYIYDIPWAIMAYIGQNYLDSITITSAAKELFINVNQINPALVHHTKMTFKEHLVLHRLRHAEALLKTTDLPISDIAMESGFNATNTFCRLFKKEHGITASSYRKANKYSREA